MADQGQNYTDMSEQQLVNQAIQLITPGGPTDPIPLSGIDQINHLIVAQTIGYGVEIGASIVMLGVILVMTPNTKFWRFHTFLNIAGLCNNIARVVMLAIYFESSWVSFYALYSSDYQFVTNTDYATSIASTVFGIPQNIMMMAALILQAWAMVRFWPKAFKWCIFLVSVILVLLEIGFMLASQVFQIMTFYLTSWYGDKLILKTAWVRYTYLGLEVACICWFCFLFIAKLVTHLYKNRSFLPTTKGLGAMDVLVMANGVLMLIPVFFTALECSEATAFQAGSMVYTSVLVVLPLGCLVAQRIADPAAFNSEHGASARMSHNPNDRFETFDSSNNKKGLLSPAWSQSDKDSAVFPGRRGSSNALSGKTGVTSIVTSGTGYKGAAGHMSMADIELARIDADLEVGQVRVDREIRQEVR